MKEPSPEALRYYGFGDPPPVRVVTFYSRPLIFVDEVPMVEPEAPTEITYAGCHYHIQIWPKRDGAAAARRPHKP